MNPIKDPQSEAPLPILKLKTDATGLLAWFASNPVAANLLMLLIMTGGFIGFKIMDKEVFPPFQSATN